MEFTLAPAPVLGGADLRIGDNRIVEQPGLAIVSIAWPQEGEAALAKALKTGWNLPFPEPTLASRSGDTLSIRSASDQMLLIFTHPSPDAERLVQDRLGGTGYTTDQTDAWVTLDISGPDTLSALERLCPLDTSQFPELGAGRTVMEHMGAIVLRLQDGTFRLMSTSSSAASFLHAVETSFRNTAPVRP